MLSRAGRRLMPRGKIWAQSPSMTGRSAVRTMTTSAEGAPHQSRWRRWALPVAVGCAGVAAVGSSITSVPAGHIGIVDFFGHVNDTLLEPGIHLANPLATIHKLTTQTQSMAETCEVPSQEGLVLKLEINVVYYLDAAKAVELYKSVGRSFFSVIVQPQVKACIRNVTSGHQAKALYSADARATMSQQLLQDLQAKLAPRGIVVTDTLLRNVVLPARLSESIEDKLKAEQDSQRMSFVLEKERKEAERKAIEAEGVSNFQRIVSTGITPGLLTWKGIEATMALSRSPNAKIVVIGSGQGGLPIILNDSVPMSKVAGDDETATVTPS